MAATWRAKSNRRLPRWSGRVASLTIRPADVPQPDEISARRQSPALHSDHAVACRAEEATDFADDAASAAIGRACEKSQCVAQCCGTHPSSTGIVDPLGVHAPGKALTNRDC